jgi:hypothetical protein
MPSEGCTNRPRWRATATRALLLLTGAIAACGSRSGTEQLTPVYIEAPELEVAAAPEDTSPPVDAELAAPSASIGAGMSCARRSSIPMRACSRGSTRARRSASSLTPASTLGTRARVPDHSARRRAPRQRRTCPSLLQRRREALRRRRHAHGRCHRPRRLDPGVCRERARAIRAAAHRRRARHLRRARSPERFRRRGGCRPARARRGHLGQGRRGFARDRAPGLAAHGQRRRGQAARSRVWRRPRRRGALCQHAAPRARRSAHSTAASSSRSSSRAMAHPGLDRARGGAGLRRRGARGRGGSAAVGSSSHSGQPTRVFEITTSSNQTF